MCRFPGTYRKVGEAFCRGPQGHGQQLCSRLPVEAIFATLIHQASGHLRAACHNAGLGRKCLLSCASRGAQPMAIFDLGHAVGLVQSICFCKSNLLQTHLQDVSSHNWMPSLVNADCFGLTSSIVDVLMCRDVLPTGLHGWSRSTHAYEVGTALAGSIVHAAGRTTWRIFEGRQPLCSLGPGFSKAPPGVSPQRPALLWARLESNAPSCDQEATETAGSSCGQLRFTCRALQHGEDPFHLCLRTLLSAGALQKPPNHLSEC